MGIRTNTAAAVLGISPSTLRTWERRYGFPAPRRSAGGHRQYDRAEVEALRDAYAETGHAASAVALARSRGGVSAPPSCSRLRAALVAFDEEAADRIAAEALAARALEAVAEAVGDARTAVLAREHRTQEEVFLGELREAIPGLAMDVIDAEVEGGPGRARSAWPAG